MGDPTEHPLYEGLVLNYGEHNAEAGSIDALSMEARLLEGTDLQILQNLGIGNFMHQFQQVGLDMDMVYHDIYDGWNSDGFLIKEYSVLMDRVWDANGQGKYDIIETIGSHNVGIWVNVLVSDGAYEICEDCNPEGAYYQEAMEARQEYRIYSSLQKFNSGFPGLREVDEGADFQFGQNYLDINDAPPSIYTQIRTYDIVMSRHEKSGFATKYAMLAGVNTGDDEYDNRIPVAEQAIEDKMASMAADIYQTMISREYVPNVIKKGKSLMDLQIKTSLGRERTDEISADTTFEMVVLDADDPEGSGYF